MSTPLEVWEATYEGVVEASCWRSKTYSSRIKIRFVYGRAKGECVFPERLNEREWLRKLSDKGIAADNPNKGLQPKAIGERLL